jgi:hypothetical protein
LLSKHQLELSQYPFYSPKPVGSHHYWNLGLCRVPGALPSAFYRALGKEVFAESRTRQSPALDKELVYRVRDTRHRDTLGKNVFAEWQTLGKDDARQRAVSGHLKLTAVSLYRGPRPALSKADSLLSVNQLTLGKEGLYRVSSLTLGKAFFYFFILATKLFVVYSYTM